MQKIYTSLTLCCLFLAAAGQPFTSTWQKLANSVDYTWLTPTGNDVNSLDYNPVTDKLLVAKRGSAVYVINVTTGAQEGTLNVTPIGDGFRLSKIRVTTDGVIYAISLSTSPGPVNIWRWASQTAAPTLCATFTATERCGDAFALSGSGSSTILYASGAGTTANAFNIYMLNTFNGINFFLESRITMTSAPVTNQQWSNRAIEPVSNSLTSDLWIKGGGFVARKISVGALNSGVRNGTLVSSLVDGVGNGQVSVGFGGMRRLTSPAGNKYLVFAGGNNSYAGTKMQMVNVTDEAAPVTYGTDSLTDPLSYITNGNGTGDAAYKFEGDGYTVFYACTNNGIEATKATGQELPVTMGTFNASLRNKTVLLEWNTLTEANNDGFSIEKSVNGRSFSPIAYLKSKAVGGNSNAALQYQFEDLNLLNGKCFYRLKQVDKDGRFAYSQTRAVQYDNGLNTISATVLTNPVVDNLLLAIQSPAKKTIQVKVTNAAGAELLRLQQAIAPGSNNLTLPLGMAGKGLLLVTITEIKGAGAPLTFKVIKD